MTSSSSNFLEDYTTARVRDVAYDAVRRLWKRRQAAGVTQKQVADRLGRDAGWVSRQLSGPGNWTFRSFGALVGALDGDVEIVVHGVEDPVVGSNNYDAYAEHTEADNFGERRWINNSKSDYFTTFARVELKSSPLLTKDLSQNPRAVYAKQHEVIDHV